MDEQDNIRGLGSSFFKDVYQPKPVVANTEAMMENLSAIINPAETLKNAQLKQVAELTAKLKLDKLRPDLIGGVLEQKEDFEDWYMNALKNNDDGTPKTGLSRLKLTDTQKIEAKKKQDELFRSAGYIDIIGNNLGKAEMKAIQEGISGDEYNEWYNGFLAKVKEASASKDPSRYPDPYVDLSNYLAQKPYSINDVNKLEKEAFAANKVFEKIATDIGGGKTQVIDQANPNIIRYQAEDLVKTDPKFKKWIDKTYGTKDNPDGLDGYVKAKLQEFGRINKNIKSQWSAAQYSPNAPGTANLEGEPLADGSGYRLMLGDKAQAIGGNGYTVNPDGSTNMNDPVVIPANTQAPNLILDNDKKPVYWEGTIKRTIPKMIGGKPNPKYKTAENEYYSHNKDKSYLEETVVVRTPANANDAAQIMGQQKVIIKKQTQQGKKAEPKPKVDY